MNTLGIKLNELPIALELEQNLSWVDGPIISLYKSKNRGDYIEFFGDTSKCYVRFLLFRAEYIDVDSYIKGKVSLQQLVKECPDGFVYIRDYDSDGVDTYFLPVKDIPEDIMPTADSFLPLKPAVKERSDKKT